MTTTAYFNTSWVYSGKYKGLQGDALKKPLPLSEASGAWLLGDWHGNWKWVSKNFWKLLKTPTETEGEKEGPKFLLHVGDLGIWPQLNFLTWLHKKLEESGTYLIAVPGNHEDWDFLASLPKNPDGFLVVTERILVAPKGLTWTMGGLNGVRPLTFMGLGGAVSVDKKHRREGVDWFPSEVISKQELQEALENGRELLSKEKEGLDVLLSHDAPTGLLIPTIDNNPAGSAWIEREILAEAQAHRGLLDLVVEDLKPKLLIHGHYHVFYKASYKYQNPSSEGVLTEGLGLGMDGAPFEENSYYLNFSKALQAWGAGKELL